MALAWHPQGEYRLRTDIPSIAIDPTVRHIRTYGYSIEDIGGAHYKRLAGAPAAPTNRAYVQSLDGAWWALSTDNEQITFDMFGMTPGTGVAGAALTANNNAMLDAVAYSQVGWGSGKVMPLQFSLGSWNLSTPIPIHRGMHLMGYGGRTDEDTRRVVVRHSSTSDAFSLPAGNTQFLKVDGICFDGIALGTHCMLPDKTDASSVLQWSSFNECGFKNFNKLFSGTYTFLDIMNSFLNNSAVPVYLKGSDCKIDNCNVGMGDALPANIPTAFCCTLDNCHLSRINKLFITGRPAMPMRLIGNCDGTIISETYFDIADLCGFYGDGARGFTLAYNTVNKCGFQMEATGHATYNALMRYHNCRNFEEIGTKFSHNENSNPGPFPGAMATHRFTATAAANSADAYIDSKNVNDGHVIDIALGDAVADWPRLGPNVPVASLVVGTSSVNGLVSDLRTVIASTSLPSAATFFLNTTRMKPGDKRLFKRTAAGAGAWNIANGLAGPTIATLTAAGQSFWAVSDGTNWF